MLMVAALNLFAGMIPSLFRDDDSQCWRCDQAEDLELVTAVCRALDHVDYGECDQCGAYEDGTLLHHA